MQGMIAIDEADIRQLIPEIQTVQFALRGGQKTVYKVVIEGQTYALKILEVPSQTPDGDVGEYSLDEADVTLARARRETGILKSCNIPQLVKLGPIELSIGTIRDKLYLFYTEEWIDGRDLRSLVSEVRYLPTADVAALGVDMATAIETLWMMSKIHRDVKPANIMRRALDQTFVLLDLGLAFDVNDISLTLSGRIPGTPPYFSPEQTDVSRKRLLDFRSDLFSLGVVLYEVTTGEHPFWKRGMAYGELVEHIRGLPARKPSELRPEAPAELDAVILRLLAKTPHMRYRSCSLLRKSLM